MKGTLVFDNLNDIIYLNCCQQFVKHVSKLASTQGLVSSEHSVLLGKGERAVDPNILVQLFSPLVTSQRFMREQFGNPYTSMQCEDGTNIVFQEFMGYLFLKIGSDEITYLKRTIGVTITLVSYICGPDVPLLKKSKYHSGLLDQLLTTWDTLYSTDQSFMMEGIQQMNVSPQFNATVVKTLQQTISKVQNQLGPNAHALLFLDSKLLSWYSTKNSVNLGPEDLLFIVQLCHKTWHKIPPSSSSSGAFVARYRQRSSSEFSSDDESVGFHSSKDDLDLDSFQHSDEWDVVKENETGLSVDESLVKYFIVFKNENEFRPQIVHVGVVQDGLYLVLVSDPATGQLMTSSCSALQQAISFYGKIRDPLTDKSLFEHLESTTKKLQDLLKKQRNTSLRNELISRWDRFKTGYNLYVKSKDSISVQTSPMVDIYREIFRTFFNQNLIANDPKVTLPLDIVWRQIKNDTEDFWGFLRMKANPNLLSEGKESISINKYLEEFPGLVHFIYIDRNRHIVILPTLDFTKEETVKLTKTKIWGMVKFARDHMQQGHFSLMWKDSAFNYAYFLWFEDTTGTPIRAKHPAMPWEGYPLPGIMCGDFYKRVMLECFPDIHPSKIRCFELFCIHLGLATSSCVLEHSKRLATNIFDEYAGGNPATDLL